MAYSGRRQAHLVAGSRAGEEHAHAGQVGHVMQQVRHRGAAGSGQAVWRRRRNQHLSCGARRTGCCRHTGSGLGLLLHLHGRGRISINASPMQWSALIPGWLAPVRRWPAMSCTLCVPCQDVSGMGARASSMQYSQGPSLRLGEGGYAEGAEAACSVQASCGLPERRPHPGPEMRRGRWKAGLPRQGGCWAGCCTPCPRPAHTNQLFSRSALAIQHARLAQPSGCPSSSQG